MKWFNVHRFCGMMWYMQGISKCKCNNNNVQWIRGDICESCIVRTHLLCWGHRADCRDAQAKRERSRWSAPQSLNIWWCCFSTVWTYIKQLIQENSHRQANCFLYNSDSRIIIYHKAFHDKSLPHVRLYSRCGHFCISASDSIWL